ncbi:MAG: hypothetical protein ACC657_12895 [Thiohalomonadales bacterium]
MLHKQNKFLWKFELFVISFIFSLISCTSEESTTSNTTTPNPVAVNATASINWVKNREIAVNSVNGGYRVYYSSSTPVTTTNSFVDVPYSQVTKTTPVTANINIKTTGKYYFAVQAYSALNPPTGSTSGLSDEFSLVIQ